jgi:aldehyde dehydrogenase (NAD+)
VQEGICDHFIAKYKAALDERAKSIGDPDDQNTVMGPLFSNSQFKRVMGCLLKHNRCRLAGT